MSWNNVSIRSSAHNLILFKSTIWKLSRTIQISLLSAHAHHTFYLAFKEGLGPCTAHITAADPEQLLLLQLNMSSLALSSAEFAFKRLEKSALKAVIPLVTVLAYLLNEYESNPLVMPTSQLMPKFMTQVLLPMFSAHDRSLVCGYEQVIGASLQTLISLLMLKILISLKCLLIQYL